MYFILNTLGLHSQTHNMQYKPELTASRAPQRWDSIKGMHPSLPSHTLERNAVAWPMQSQVFTSRIQIQTAKVCFSVPCRWDQRALSPVTNGLQELTGWLCVHQTGPNPRRSNIILTTLSTVAGKPAAIQTETDWWRWAKQKDKANVAEGDGRFLEAHGRTVRSILCNEGKVWGKVNHIVEK